MRYAKKIPTILIPIFYCAIVGYSSLRAHAWQTDYILPIDDKLHFNVSPKLSIQYGTVNEYVFDNESKVSELDWAVSPLICVGIDIGLHYNRFAFNGSYSQAVNTNTGHIEDYDWNSSTGAWTNYSKHEETQKGSLFTNISIGYSVPFFYIFSCGIIVGYKYSDLQFCAENGYLEYPPGSSKVKVYGKGIIYEQKYSIPYAGINVSVMLPWFDCAGYFNYSFLGICSDRDSHLLRSIDFYDTMKNIQYYNAGLILSKNISDNFSMGIRLDMDYIPLSKGESYNIDLTTGLRSSTVKKSAGIKTWLYGVQVFLISKIM